MNILIFGISNVGKSSIGKRIAEKLQYEFIDIDDEIKKYVPRTVLFNFSNVSFMDSSGIGMLLGRYRKIIRTGGTTEMCALNAELKRVFEMSGILKIISIIENNNRDVLKDKFIS